MAKKRKKGKTTPAITGLITGLAGAATETVKGAASKLGLASDQAGADGSAAAQPDKVKGKDKKRKGAADKKSAKVKKGADRLLRKLAKAASRRARRIAARVEALAKKREGLLDELQGLYSTIGRELKRYGRSATAALGSEAPPQKGSKKGSKKGSRRSGRSRKGRARATAESSGADAAGESA